MKILDDKRLWNHPENELNPDPCSQRDMGAYVFLSNAGHHDNLNRGFKSSLHEICNDRLNKQENRGMP
ncbi:hypothetical protein QQF64_000675 [Cirrhinus molitorella]|uniref:Uncharacterized protein n=1 Tax=Cirrhinus molitorella TaxID=172907 RepID=A0ABR3NYF5_9TELE